MEEEVKILCVDDERNVLKALQRLFMDEDWELLTASSGEEGLEIMETNPEIQVIISDYRMPGMNGVDFLQKVYERWPATIRIVLSGYADTASVVAAINDGQIYKFIPKPWNDDELKNNIARAVEVHFLHKKNLLLTEELQHSNEELQILNENLEKLVAERTGELIFQNMVLARSQNILDALPVVVLGLDMDDVIVQCNRWGMKLLIDQPAIIGSACRQVLPAGLCDFITKIGAEGASGQAMIAGRSFLLKGCLMQSGDGQAGKIVVLIDG